MEKMRRLRRPRRRRRREAQTFAFFRPSLPEKAAGDNFSLVLNNVPRLLFHAPLAVRLLPHLSAHFRRSPFD